MHAHGKKEVSVAVVGDCNAGKSTTIARLLFELGGMSERSLEKTRREAAALGKESYLFAFFMDRLVEERKSGFSIKCTLREFFTENYHYSVVDTPGHKNYINNMIRGLSQTDVALFIVSAEKGIFEKSIKTPLSHTRMYAQLCYSLGLKQLIVCVNKMDCVKYSESRFTFIKKEMEKLLINEIGYKLNEFVIVPISGFRGDNLTTRIRFGENNMPWWKGFGFKSDNDDDDDDERVITGLTLICALDKFIKEPKRILKKPFRMAVSNYYKIMGVGDVVAGRVEQGTIQPGVDVKFFPSGIKGKLFSIESHHKTQQQGDCGMYKYPCTKLH